MHQTRVLLHVTSYGPFYTIKENPSALVAERVCANIRKAHTEGSHPWQNVEVVDYVELEVSVAAADAYFTSKADELKKLLSSEEQDSSAAEDTVIFLLHFGVHSGELRGAIHLETTGYNELHCNIPDVNGLELNHRPISKDKSLNSSLATTLPFELLQEIADARNTSNAATSAVEAPDSLVRRTLPVWHVSQDAGRYLCNYCLYRSLQIGESHNCTNGPTPRVVSLFIHVSDPKQGKASYVGSEQDVSLFALDAIRSVFNPSIETQVAEVELVVQEIITKYMQSEPIAHQ